MPLGIYFPTDGGGLGAGRVFASWSEGQQELAPYHSGSSLDVTHSLSQNIGFVEGVRLH
jgi:hypothetical protein